MNTKIIKALEQSGIKPTPNRMLVLEQFFLHERNLTLSELEKILFPSDRSSIYRTLQTFEQNGLVHSTIIGNNKGAHYALCYGECNDQKHFDDHAHFECEICGEVTCSDLFLTNLKVKDNHNMPKINKIELKITGICPKCKNKG